MFPYTSEYSLFIYFSSSLMEILYSSNLINILHMRFFIWGDTLSFLGKFIFFFIASRSSAIEDAVSHGQNPQSILYIITPRLQTSHFMLYGSLSITCGDMQQGVPIAVWMVGLSFFTEFSIAFANPKSLILATPLLRSMFQGLRSRWNMLRSQRNEHPATISLKILSAYFQGSCPLFQMILLRSLCHSIQYPCQQNSLKKQMLLGVQEQSQNCTMFLCASSFQVFIQFFMLLMMQDFLAYLFSAT